MFNRNELRTLVENEIKGDFFVSGHLKRCFNKIHLIKETEFDEEIVFAGIMLHAIGFPQHLKFNQDLISTSLNLAKRFLQKSSFPKEKIDSVLHCIEESHLKGKPKTPEAILVHDLNLLDEIGALGILKDSLLFKLKKISLQEFLEKQKTKSFLLNEAFIGEKAKKEAEKGISLFNSFVKALEEELKFTEKKDNPKIVLKQ
jgi:hypothetical protein